MMSTLRTWRLIRTVRTMSVAITEPPPVRIRHVGPIHGVAGLYTLPIPTQEAGRWGARTGTCRPRGHRFNSLLRSVKSC